MPAVHRVEERPIDFGYIDTLGCNRNYFDFVLKIARNDFVAHLIAIKQKGDFIECEKIFLHMAEAERAKVLRTFLLTRVDEFRFP